MPTSFPFGSSFIESTYRSGVILETERSTNLMSFAGKGNRAAFQIHDREGNGRGDNVTLYFNAWDSTAAPKTRSSQVLGAEEGATNYSDNVDLRYFLLDGGVENVIVDQEMNSIDVKNQERSRISLRWGTLMERWFLNHLAGTAAASVAAASDFGLSGGNAVTVQNNIIYAPDSSGANTTDAAVASATDAVLTSEMIDEAVKQAGSKDYVTWPFAPCETPYGDLFVLVTSGDGFQQIKQNTSASDIFTIAQAKIQGGNSVENNELITGEAFIYDRTLVLKSDFVPTSATSNDVRYSVFFGAGACDIVRGTGFTEGNWLGWSEHMQHRRWSCFADTLCGVKRRIVNGASWASIRIVHHDPPAVAAT